MLCSVFTVLAVALAAPGAHAFFRMPCSQPIVVERADSIVTPGLVSGHVHSVLGGNGFGLSQTFAQTRNATCSTCMAKDDMSNYWMPAMYYRRQDGKFEKVPQIGGATIYYLQRRATSSEKLVAFPDKFQMLAGNPTLRSYNASRLDQQAISWVCLDYSGSGAGGEYKHFPDHHCPNGVRQQVFFPSCWNGKDTDATDHKSHMAYPDRMDAGKCPSTHPVRTVSLFYEIIWDTAVFKFWKPSGADQPFVTAHGDPTGYGGHGDFFNGWDKSALQRAIDGCNQESGVIEDCSSVLRLRSNDQMNACSLDAHINERVTGVLATLPGCNPVTNGPGVAAMPTSCALSGAAAANLIMTPGTSLYMKYDIPGWKPVGCAIDSLGSRTLSQASTASDDMTVEKCTSYCKSKSYKYAGLEYGRECWCSNSLDKSKVGTYKCDQACAGNSLEYCGNGGRLSVYEAGTYVPPTSSSSSSSQPTSTSTTTTTSTASPAQPTSASVTGFDTLGCHVDAKASRVLKGTEMFAAENMTPSVCAARCQKAGFKLAGVEYGKECFCGNSLITTNKVADSQCSMACAGNAGQRCGAGDRILVYRVKGSSTSTAPPTTTTTPAGKLPLSPAPKGFTSVGCFVDSVASRNLKGSSLVSSTMTASKCTAYCASKGFTYSGIEYSKECFCGNTVNAARAATNDCTTMACAGDSKVSCGAGNRIQIFKKTAGKRELHSRRLSIH